MHHRNYNIGESNYAKKNIQPWDIIRNWKLDFFEGNIIKYIVRVKPNTRIEDLKKACHYIQEIIEYTKTMQNRTFNETTYTASDIINEYNLHEKQEAEIIHYLRDAFKTNDLIEYKIYLRFALADLRGMIK